MWSLFEPRKIFVVLYVFSTCFDNYKYALRLHKTRPSWRSNWWNVSVRQSIPPRSLYVRNGWSLKEISKFMWIYKCTSYLSICLYRSSWCMALLIYACLWLWNNWYWILWCHNQLTLIFSFGFVQLKNLWDKRMHFHARWEIFLWTRNLY